MTLEETSEFGEEYAAPFLKTGDCTSPRKMKSPATRGILQTLDYFILWSIVSSPSD